MGGHGGGGNLEGNAHTFEIKNQDSPDHVLNIFKLKVIINP